MVQKAHPSFIIIVSTQQNTPLCQQPNYLTRLFGGNVHSLAPWLWSFVTCNTKHALSSLSLSPYCQVATLPRGEYDLYCDSTSQRSTDSLEYLEDWFATGINPLSASTTDEPTPIISTTTSHPTPIITTSPRQSSAPTAITSSSGGGLAAPAIAGIGVAVGAVVVGAIAGLGICLFLRRRKRKEGTNQPVEVSTGPSKHSMQQGNLGQGWQTVAPASSPYPNSQTAFLKNPEQPSPPYSSQPASIHNTHSPSLSSPVMPYDSISRTGSTGLYPLSQNPSATAPSNNKIPPSLMPAAHKPGELPRFNNSSDHTAQPPSPISGVGQHGGETRSGSPIDNQVHEMATGFSLHNNPRGSVTSQSPPYHEVSSSVASPTRQSSGTQSPPPLHPIHEAPAYHNENQARGIVSSPTSRQSGPGAYHEAAHPPREISAGDGGSHSYSNNISSNTGQHDMSPPTPAAPAVVAPASFINSGTYEGQQQAQYDIHKAPATNYKAYSPGTM